MAAWHSITPRAVWIIRPGVTPLPAWLGILLAWQRTDPEPPKPARWMGLVVYSRGTGPLFEQGWFFDTQLRPSAERPPMCGLSGVITPGDS